MAALRFERGWPYLAAVLAVVGWWFIADGRFPSKPDALLGASGGASAVLVGFLATSKTIILALNGSAVMTKIREAGYQVTLFTYLYSAIAWGFGLLVISIIGFIVQTESGLPAYFEGLWVAVACLASFTYWRVTNILFKVLRWA